MVAERPNELYVLANPLAVWALILGVAGLFLSIFVAGGVVGLAAVIVGILALRRGSKELLAIGGMVTGGLAIPAAVVALVMWGGILHGHARFASSSRRLATIVTLSDTRNAVNRFEIDVGRFPTTEEGLAALIVDPAGLATWQGPYLDKMPVDAWGQALVYKCPGTADPNSYDLYSIGADGVEGTEDDIAKNAEE